MSDWAFGFADLSGYTALTEAHGDDTAADVAERFYSAARGAVRPGVRFVKTIGDAVMLASTDVVALLESMRALARAVESEPRFPSLRAGLHFGTATARGDDFFGAAEPPRTRGPERSFARLPSSFESKIPPASRFARSAL